MGNDRHKFTTAKAQNEAAQLFKKISREKTEKADVTKTRKCKQK